MIIHGLKKLARSSWLAVATSIVLSVRIGFTFWMVFKFAVLGVIFTFVIPGVLIEVFASLGPKIKEFRRVVFITLVFFVIFYLIIDVGSAQLLLFSLGDN